MELEEKVMATYDKIQVSINEGSVLRTQDYEVRDFRSQKYQDLDLGHEKRREERKRRRAWQGER